MSKIKIEGGHKLTGEIEISGAKNSAVALVPAAILCDEEVKISNGQAIFFIHGRKLMELTHKIYERCLR